MKVDNTLKGDGSQLSVELEFKKLADFEPEQVVRQVQPLNELLEVRNKLKDLLSRTEGNDRLEELLDAIISKPDVREKLAALSGDKGSEGKN
jgi:type VI secretion system protein ImpB